MANGNLVDGVILVEGINSSSEDRGFRLSELAQVLAAHLNLEEKFKSITNVITDIEEDIRYGKTSLRKTDPCPPPNTEGTADPYPDEMLIDEDPPHEPYLMLLRATLADRIAVQRQVANEFTDAGDFTQATQRHLLVHYLNDWLRATW